MPLPQKNKADKNWLDRLPPTMLRDMRQSLQAPVHLGLLLISVLFTYLCCANADSTAWPAVTFFFLLITAGLIPIHIGMNVAADIKAGSSNFLKLCPLPAGKIIWGQFLSGLVQIVAVVVLLSPLYLAAFGSLCKGCDYQPYFWGAAQSLGSLAGLSFILTMLFSALALAFTMLMAWLPMVPRLALQMALGIAILFFCNPIILNRCYTTKYEAPEFITHFPSLFVGCLLVTTACLLLARRHYQAATEHRSGGVRLIALLLLALPALNESLLPTGDWLSMLYSTVYCLIAALILLLLDVLMPKQAASRPIASLLCMVGLCVLSVASFPLMAHGGLLPELGQSYTSASTLLVYAIAQLLAIIFFSLAGCQLFMERSSRHRLLGFLIALLFASTILLPLLGVDTVLGMLPSRFRGLAPELAPELLQDALAAGKIQGLALLVIALTTFFGPLHWRRKSKNAAALAAPCPSTAPSRSGKKKLLDYLPASLLLDMRQFLRSPLYILAAWAVIVWIYKGLWAPDRNGITATMLSHIGLLSIIALRASNKVARDIREGGSNFLKLCPLPAWRIIAGQFGAAALQMLILSLLLLPLYLHHVQLLPEDNLRDDYLASYCRHCATAPYLIALLSFFMGMLLCAGAMVLACLPVLFRAITLLMTAGTLTALCIGWATDLPFSRETGWMSHVPLANCLVLFAMLQALLFTAILLLLGCPYYSSSRKANARTTAWAKRLSWLSMGLGLLFFFGMRCSIGAESFAERASDFANPWYHLSLCFSPYLTIFLTMELLPREGPSQTKANIIHLLLMMAAFIGSTLILAKLTEGWSVACTPLSGDQIQDICYYPIALVGSFCLPMGFAKLVLQDTSRYQILVYGIATCLIAMICLSGDYAPFGCLDLKLSESLSSANFIAVIIGTLMSLGFVWAARHMNPQNN